ncbi:uncharacterized protein LOC108914567 [Anoplophora glabripennis]|uniref:uncharacterized protein LOC108914567 n=1 Tax=Anoplophora glabripennis TaxID=217634 RepID=UPI000874CE92|nr:uncharacterized protein LOC108914567 [Anoplophora glabripennis]
MEKDNYEESENKTGLDFLSNNVNVSELDEETNTKLRGDAIGETLYSQSFVLKTLLQFSDLKWDEDLEEDLCFLWDMTLEKDVCKYLFEISFPTVACSALEKYTENRFIEIVIGILANILCGDCKKSISEDEVNIVLRELNTDDHLILIQVIRFIIALSHMYNDLQFISKDVVDKLIFILNNSTSNDLLTKSLEGLSEVMSDFKLDRSLINIEIIKSSLTAYKSVVDDLDEFSLDTKDKQLCCKYMLETVSNYCAYIEVCDTNDLIIEFRNCSNVFVNEIIKLLNWFSLEENLVPVTDEIIFYMSAVKYILETLNINYISDIFFPLTKILYIVSDFKDEIIELFDTVVELECYLCVHSTQEDLYRDFKHFPKNRAKKILAILYENQHKFNFSLNLNYVQDKFK